VLATAALGGCATSALTPGSTLNLAAPCLPPGVSEEFFFWPIVAHRPLTLRTEDGDEVQAAWVVYARMSHAVAVIWAGDHLVAVDPSPDTDEPDWIDTAFVVPDEDGFILRANPGAPCLWERNTDSVRVKTEL
jgi:hypothetical protein